jgi:hypothetical protein
VCVCVGGGGLIGDLLPSQNNELSKSQQ